MGVGFVTRLPLEVCLSLRRCLGWVLAGVGAVGIRYCVAASGGILVVGGLRPLAGRGGCQLVVPASRLALWAPGFVGRRRDFCGW